jgi:hypothetical protein
VRGNAAFLLIRAAHQQNLQTQARVSLMRVAPTGFFPRIPFLEVTSAIAIPLEPIL